MLILRNPGDLDRDCCGPASHVFCTRPVCQAGRARTWCGRPGIAEKAVYGSLGGFSLSENRLNLHIMACLETSAPSSPLRLHAG